MTDVIWLGWLGKVDGCGKVDFHWRVFDYAR